MSANVLEIAQAISDEFAARQGITMPKAKTSPDAGPLVFRPIYELLLKPTQVNWLLRGIIEQNVIVLLAGKRGTFKSFLAPHWALTLAGDRLAKAEARIATLERERTKTLADAFRGGYLPGTSYGRGDVVQRQDATWLCLRDTTGEPGNSGDWRLMGITR